ncbi:MAG: tRNA (guanine(10)-N(2))-dimethyltransferase, partial [Thermoplasmata archaeon]
MGEIDLLEGLVEVQEGLARILVPRGHTVKGPGRVSGSPFYNRTMAFPRHVSVLFLEAIGSKVRRVLDGLSSTGVLGIRLTLETNDEFEITLNDRRRDAHDLIVRNVELNGVGHARATCEDLNSLLCREHFEYVDVDPFGSPVPFVDNALRSLRPKGFLGVTATDAAALAGTYPRTCLRRYGTVSIKAPFSHEAGLRILAGYIVRTAAKYDMAARPLLSLWREHYYRAYFELLRGARRADDAVRELGYVHYQPRGPRGIEPRGEVGPLWKGPLYDDELLGRMRARDYMPRDVSRYLEMWQAESRAPPLFYTTDEVASRLRIQAPSMKRVLGRLSDAGFVACRTSFHPKGFKTTASWDEVL